MTQRYRGRTTHTGFYADSTEMDAVRACAAKNRAKNAEWIRGVLMKAAAAELGVPYASLDRHDPAYGDFGPRSAPSAPSKDRIAFAERLAAVNLEVDRIQAAADAKRAAAAKLEEALAELDALGGSPDLSPVVSARTLASG